ncbi:MAG: Sec-independent protein translocase protein TatB [Halieaceae bacterium]
MFDIGFFELLLISVVGLLVFGPEQFLDAVRITTRWVKRIRRSFDEVRTDIQRELHNDEVMRELKASANDLEKQVKDLTAPVKEQIHQVETAVQSQTSEENADLFSQPSTVGDDRDKETKTSRD